MSLACVHAIGCVSQGATTIDNKPQVEAKRFGDTDCGRFCARLEEHGCTAPDDCEVNCADNRVADPFCTEAFDRAMVCQIEVENPECFLSSPSFKIDKCTVEAEALGKCQEREQLCEVPSGADACTTCAKKDCCSVMQECLSDADCYRAQDEFQKCVADANTDADADRCMEALGPSDSKGAKYVGCVLDCSKRC